MDTPRPPRRFPFILGVVLAVAAASSWHSRSTWDAPGVPRVGWRGTVWPLHTWPLASGSISVLGRRTSIAEEAACRPSSWRRVRAATAGHGARSTTPSRRRHGPAPTTGPGAGEVIPAEAYPGRRRRDLRAVLARRANRAVHRGRPFARWRVWACLRGDHRAETGRARPRRRVQPGPGVLVDPPSSRHHSGRIRRTSMACGPTSRRSTPSTGSRARPSSGRRRWPACRSRSSSLHATNRASTRPPTRLIADAWLAAFESLSPGQITHTIAWGAGHDIQIDRPDLVIEATRRLIALAR